MAESIRKDKFFKVMRDIREGDIVLFRTERALSQLQRFFCNTEYDHIGIVVAWDNCSPSCCSDLLKSARKQAGTKAWHTLEVDSTNGVQLHRLTPACVSSYNGVAYVRHLDISSISEAKYAMACAMLQRFVGAVIGAPYENSIYNIVRAADLFGTLVEPKHTQDRRKREVLLNPFEMQRLAPEELPPVFCSELVAAAYMVMGFLSQDGRDPGMYIPGDFSSKTAAGRGLNFVDGIKLGEEIMIDSEDLSMYDSEGEEECDQIGKTIIDSSSTLGVSMGNTSIKNDMIVRKITLESVPATSLLRARLPRAMQLSVHTHSRRDESISEPSSALQARRLRAQSKGFYTS
mmetsp:Transcript_9803/g.16048  ORF Transcript_9803/g.16048 Transcript_9803/m.16048 type:complete len:346 (-) Transcript_9803:3165-4202(-)